MWHPDIAGDDALDEPGVLVFERTFRADGVTAHIVVHQSQQRVVKFQVESVVTGGYHGPVYRDVGGDGFLDVVRLDMAWRPKFVAAYQQCAQLLDVIFVTPLGGQAGRGHFEGLSQFDQIAVVGGGEVVGDGRAAAQEST